MEWESVIPVSVKLQNADGEEIFCADMGERERGGFQFAISHKSRRITIQCSESFCPSFHFQGNDDRELGVCLTKFKLFYQGG